MPFGIHQLLSIICMGSLCKVEENVAFKCCDLFHHIRSIPAHQGRGELESTR